LSSSFAIEICAYAVMSNHYHLVLHVNREDARRWSREEVAARWTAIFAAPELVMRWLNGRASGLERELAEATIDTWRERLHDISWFMKCMNEYLARRGNAEDQCTGRFWEGRFRSQALLDEAGLLTAMTYVDLNPIRAGIASTPEQSDYTSIYERICTFKDSMNATSAPRRVLAVPLRPFRGSRAHSQVQTIPFRWEDYLQLVQWTGRVIRPNKRGYIDDRPPPIMQRLSINGDAWRLAMRPAGNVFGRALGRLGRLQLHAKTLGQSWVRGLRQAGKLYAS
jgi:REP element-mobilizing transposase RayT